MDILRTLASSGVECHKGSLCLRPAPSPGCTLGIPRTQARRCLHRCRVPSTADDLWSCSLLLPSASSFHPCPGYVSFPTRPTDSSPTGSSSSRPPIPALGLHPALGSPAGGNVCCRLVWCSAGCRRGRSHCPVDGDVTETPRGMLKKKKNNDMMKLLRQTA